MHSHFESLLVIGSLGTFQIIMVAVLLGVLAIPVVIAVVVLLIVRSRKSQRQIPPPMPNKLESGPNELS
jgi:hypothetical protein